MVSQIEDEEYGGGLGDARYNIDENRRTLGQMKEGWSRLESLPTDSTEQRKLSRDLGLVVDSANRGRPLFDKMFLNPILHVPVERLHADSLVSCFTDLKYWFTSIVERVHRAVMGFPLSLFAAMFAVFASKLYPGVASEEPGRCLSAGGKTFLSPFSQGTTTNMQTFFLELLSTDGRKLVMSVMAQRNTLYPPGVAPLKCIVSNFSSLTGSDRWVLASFMLLVFKPVLQDLDSMVRWHFVDRGWNRHRGFPGCILPFFTPGFVTSLVTHVVILALHVLRTQHLPDGL